MNTVATLVETHGRERPDAPVLMAPGRPDLTYAGLFAHVRRTSAALAAAGVGPGDRVAIVLPNGPEMASSFLAVAACATSAPLNPAYRRQEHEFYLDDLAAAALLVAQGSDSPAVGVARERGIPVLETTVDPAEPAGVFGLRHDGETLGAETPAVLASPDDVALILHTSGTTSRPKMVPLTQTNVTASADNVAATLALTPGDRCLNVMPLFHIHGLIAAVLASVRAGASIVATPGYDATRFFEWLDAHEPTWYTAVPTMHQGILARAERHREVLARRPLRFVRSSSASLPPQVMARLEEVFSAPVVEAYGMTEAAHQMACNQLPPRARKPGSVGPAAGPEVEIMDEESPRLLARGETGEVVIRGPNVTPGYAANPEANATAFTESWFRTGDQGYFDEDGYLFLTGRLKEMINRAGENISPREIDEVLLDHPGVAQAVTFAMPDPGVGEEVAAAIVRAEGSDVDEQALWSFAGTRLADFKVPRRFVFLDAVPKGPTGKLQRIGLADKLGLTAPVGAEEDREPETEEERALAAAAAELLGVDRVGMRADFFALGGDSILGTRLVAEAAEILGREVPPYALFRKPTLEGLLEAVAEATPTPPLRPRRIDPGEPSPTTSFQDMLWIYDRLVPDTAVNHRAGALRLEGPLDESRLRAALDALFLGHEALRTRLPASGSRPAMVVDLDVRPELEILGSEDESSYLRRPFDPEGGPLARFALIAHGREDHRLLVDVHHAVFDAWSMSIVARDIARFYEDPGAAEPTGLSFRDVAAWRREREDEGAHAAGLAWWRDRLADAPRTALPPREGEEGDGAEGGAVVVDVPAEVAKAFERRGRAAGLTPFLTHLAVFDGVLARFAGTDDVVVGVPTAGRDREGTTDVVGLLMDFIVLRADLSGDPDLETTMGRVRQTAVEAFARQDVPFTSVVRDLRPPVRIGRNPLFDVTFQIKPFAPLRMTAGDLRIREEGAWAGDARNDLYVEIVPEESGATARFEYRTGRLGADEVRRLAAAWLRAVEAAASGEGRS